MRSLYVKKVKELVDIKGCYSANDVGEIEIEIEIDPYKIIIDDIYHSSKEDLLFLRDKIYDLSDIIDSEYDRRFNKI